MFDQDETPVKLPDESGAAAVDPTTTDPAELSDDELDSQTQALWAHVHVAMGRAVALQAEINRRGLWGTWGARSPGQWAVVARRAVEYRGHQAVRSGGPHRRLPGDQEGADRRRVEPRQGRRDHPGRDPMRPRTLPHYARHAPTAKLEVIARAYRKLTESGDECGDDTDRHRRRYLTTFFDEHCDYIIKGRLTPAAGAVVEKALGVPRQDPVGPRGRQPRRATPTPWSRSPTPRSERWTTHRGGPLPGRRARQRRCLETGAVRGRTRSGDRPRDRAPHRV
jgi:hypothetical protein